MHNKIAYLPLKVKKKKNKWRIISWFPILLHNKKISTPLMLNNLTLKLKGIHVILLFFLYN
jgi:hypothetical protein